MSAATGTDWTRILSDPDLVRHVGKLLQAYREAPAEKREEALLAAMREIKAGGLTSGKSASASKPAPGPVPTPTPTPASATPPFEPDLFSPNWGSDRRRHPRIKCFVAVELRVDEVPAPIWGNLSNTSARRMSGRNGAPGEAGVESGNRPLGAQRKDLGQGLCANRGGHPQQDRPTEFACVSKEWHLPSATACASS